MRAPESLGLWSVLVLCSQVHAGTFGGDLALTSDYIFRGISQGDADPAAQLDLHYAAGSGTFVGVFASTLSQLYGHGYRGELQPYLGQRFELSSTWSATVSLIDYSYLGGNVPVSNDSQELSAALSFLDRLTVTAAASPNAARYSDRYRLGRYAAYVADASAQLPLTGRWWLSGGIGYQSLRGPEPGTYAYGNLGVVLQYRALRVTAGYYVVQKRAQTLFLYGRAIDRAALTIDWNF
jgi:uncharacterized protein (TIGR02001 family)